MSEQLVGVVEEVINNGTGKGSGLRVGGKKYGVYDPVASRLNTINVGDNVSFRYTEKPGSGGVVYKNVQGVITVTTATPTVTENTNTSPAQKVYSRGKFPIDPRDGQRSIIRQNALTNARELWVDMLGVVSDTEGKDMEKLVEDIIDTARRFESYTAGDEIRTRAEQMMEQFDGDD